MKRSYSVLLSILIGVTLFIFMLPLQFDMYIPTFHSIISIILTASTISMFSLVLYKLLRKTLISNTITIIIYFSVILGIIHGLYSTMFWSSWICLGIIAVILIIMLFCLFYQKRKQ